MRESAIRIQSYFNENGYTCTVMELPETTRTAEEAAKAIGCEVAQIAKSLVFKEKGTGEPILIIASGVNRVDLSKIENACGVRLEKADGKFVKERLGYAIGGVPPVGHKEKLRTVIDPDLQRFESIWAAAGTPFAVVNIALSDLRQMTGGEFVYLKEA